MKKARRFYLTWSAGFAFFGLGVAAIVAAAASLWIFARWLIGELFR